MRTTRFALALALALPLASLAAEITLTPDELAELQGEPGPAGPAGPQGPAGPAGVDGAPGTRITELAGLCSAEIGGQVFEWACTAAGDATEPPPDEPTDPAPPGDPDPTGSHVLPGGRVQLVWTAPTHYVDCGTPVLEHCGEALPAGTITRYRVSSRGAGEVWHYGGTTLTANLRMTASGCYRVRALIGELGSAMSNELCLKETE